MSSIDSNNSSNRMHYTVHCQRSGLPIVSLDFVITAGTMPYMQLWDDRVVFHPVFAMEPGRLLEFSRKEWNRLAQAARDEVISHDEGQMLCLCFLALLHSLESVRQERPALPPLAVVQSNMQALVSLAAWKFYLRSARFAFPELSLSKMNDNLDFKHIGDYIDVCYQARADYEKGVDDAVEAEQVRATARAIAALNSTWVKPVSKKLLWQWVRSHLPEKWQADAVGWLGTLFLGSKATVLEFEREDVDLAIEVITSSMPAGSGVMHAVKQRLDEILSQWEAHYEAWEVMPEDPVTKILVNGIATATPHPGSEPQLEQFSSRAMWLQACAKWRLAMAQWNKENPQ